MGSRDDRFWAEFLGVDASAWASRGVSVRAHVGLADEAFLASLLGDDLERVIGPAFQGCLEPSRFRPVVADGVRFVGPDDSAAVDRFRAECGEDVWQSGSLHKVENYNPELHGRGHGTAVVSAVVAAALGDGKLLLYQTLEANRAAVQIALKLGYEQYARHMAVRLKRESPSKRVVGGTTS